MLPLLTRHASRIAAVLVLALGGVIAVLAITDDASDLDERHPSRAAAEAQAEAEEAAEEFRNEHVDYIAETAGADVTVKAEAVGDYAQDKAEGLDDAAEEAAMNTNPTSVDIPSSCDEFSGNRATGCAITLEWGFDLEQFGCLEKLWTKESGWNELAANPRGAYGIPQAYPGSKMASEADDWETNPVTQIRWGLGYIQGKYDTPCAAWAQSEAEDFY
ncbi:hypothetical protein [Glycomyces salinus]|uniref:aggregation-promoting factor C-terminal-like domain-containing protein n=1 Tax=Glycomyces salinus TaxID=980294 RepID=UPI0018ED537F|nr:hypothetical protein [Glycomyces salinus]